MISEDQKRRVNLPLFNDKIAVGWPSPADDYVERSIDLNEYLVKNSAATYFLRAAGDSMINAGIHNDAILIVDRSIEPTDGKIVIASVDGSYTCKRLQLYPKPRLISENIKYPPIKIDKKEDFEIIGVVLAAINQF
tara:strand:- start:151 stop:558 length:408 start_codon:yes stop_codon:yes gene_type:complete